jgi:hypothetical protein
MGHILYGSTPTVIELDDRTLAHIELVTLAKLRRSESFAFTVDGPNGARSTYWINASITLEFHFEVGRQDINRDWLDLIIDTANSTSGMRVMPEPTAPVAPTTKGDSPK